MTDPKGEKPQPNQPHEDDLSLELHKDQEDLPLAGGDNLPEALSLNASTDEFQFSGPAEELDFTEPADFAFPTEQPAEAAAEQSEDFAAAEPAEAQSLFGAEESLAASSLSEEAAIEPELASEGI
ncbi:MAG: hypothetical protein ABSG53_12205, partial [Thermoguttaceae bacterium]